MSRTGKLGKKRLKNAPRGPAAARPRRRLAPAARRAELLGVALAVFARRGIGRATHAEVAADAGCSLGTTFVYFPTREALVTAVLDEIERFYFEMVRSDRRPADPAREVIRDQIRAFTASVVSHPDHARVWLEWSTAIREEIWPRYVAFQERIVEALETTFERGQADGEISTRLDGENAARLLVGTAHMLAQMKFSGQPSSKIDHFVGTLLRAAFGIEA